MAEMLNEEQLAVKCIVLINSCVERNYPACTSFPTRWPVRSGGSPADEVAPTVRYAFDISLG